MSRFTCGPVPRCTDQKRVTIADFFDSRGFGDRKRARKYRVKKANGALRHWRVTILGGGTCLLAAGRSPSNSDYLIPWDAEVASPDGAP
ncbi:hypothetical protein GQ53DRAFT_753796 [Thozetella sp. PMI_491]|nr:hypothetical protein GQ53DRAFT_753796 [Thozetella sp. PMI_491]